MSLLDKTNLLITPNAVKAGKLYSVIPANGTGDCTVVRNTTATYFNSSMILVSAAANLPRINYLTVEGNPFLLDEPQRTNLQTFSNDFTNAVWEKTSSTIRQGSGSQAIVTPNYSLSPGNVQNASRLQLNLNGGVLSSDRSGISSSFTINIGATYSFSIWLKSNLSSTNVLLQSTGPGQELLLANVTTSWQRFELRLNTASSANTQFRIYLTGNGASNAADLSIYEAQVEEGSLASSNIFTSTAAVTRNADVITVAPPVGTVKITTTFSNNTTQVITSIPALFTVPEGLIKQVLMQSSL
jgi:hypothetical protein